MSLKEPPVAATLKRARIGVVVLNYDSAEDTLACLELLRGQQGPEVRTWVVDNASSDGSAGTIPPRLRENEVWVEAGENLGYAGGNNLGIRLALEWGADHVLVLNPDCRPDPGFLQPLAIALESHPRGGVAVPMILDESKDTLQSYGGSHSPWTGRAARRLFGKRADTASLEPWESVDFPPGACMLVQRECFEHTGLLHESFFLYYEDVEFGLRARDAGWVILATRRSRVRHRDTTRARRPDPLITYLGVRNQVWVERLHAKTLPFSVFLLLSAAVRWPAKTLLNLARGRFRCAWSVARGALHGAFGRGLRDRSHMALPLQGRGTRFLAPPPSRSSYHNS